MKIDVEKSFVREQELRRLEAELEDVHTKLTQFEMTDDSAQKDMFERFVDSFPDVMTGDREYVRYEPEFIINFKQEWDRILREDSGKHIRNSPAYMKSCLWDWLKRWKIEEYNLLATLE